MWQVVVEAGAVRWVGTPVAVVESAKATAVVMEANKGAATAVAVKGTG